MKILKASFILVIIFFPFIYVTDLYFTFLFNFKITSVNDWNIIKIFWQKGGVIKTSKDYFLLTSIILNPVFFVILWRYFYKKSLVAPFLYIIKKYNNYVINKYGQETKRIILKNLCRTEDKKQEIQDLKPNVEASKQASQSIREAVRQKLTNN